jgi:HSP20 family protein
MVLQRMNTAWPFGDLRNEINRLFEQAVGPSNSGSIFGARAFPAINLWEDGELVYVEAEIPGVPMNDIEINVVGNELSIKGQRGCRCDESVTFHRRERGVGDFSRFLTLPVAIDADKVEAVVKNGVLTIKLPKAEAAKPRRIEVKTR